MIARLLAALRKKSKKNTYCRELKPTLPTDQQIALYLPLIEEFTDGQIDAPQFEARYIQLVKSIPEILDRDVSDVINHLFGDADYYEPYEYLRDSETLDDAELLECAITARDKLEEILKSHREKTAAE